MAKSSKRRSSTIPKACPRQMRIIGDDDDREFEVVKIHAKKMVRVKGKLIPYYLMEFKGFGMDQCSYEPITSLNCPELIAEYEAEAAARKARTKAKSAVKKRKNGSKLNNTIASTSSSTSSNNPYKLRPRPSMAGHSVDGSMLSEQDTVGSFRSL